jgi:gluconate kinase
MMDPRLAKTTQALLRAYKGEPLTDDDRALILDLIDRLPKLEQARIDLSWVDNPDRMGS